MEDPRLDAVGSPELRSALMFVRARPVPATADELADAQGVHRNVARARLERLARAGLLVTSFERRSGRSGPGAGRPAKVYAPAPELAAIEFPQRRLADLVGLLIAGRPGRELGRVGRSFGELLARDGGLERGSGVEALTKAMGTLGFQASVLESTPKRVTLTTPTCPLRPLVAARPEASAVDAAMWASLVGAATGRGASAPARCTTEGCLQGGGPCRITVGF